MDKFQACVLPGVKSPEIKETRGRPRDFLFSHLWPAQHGIPHPVVEWDGSQNFPRSKRKNKAVLGDSRALCCPCLEKANIQIGSPQWDHPNVHPLLPFPPRQVSLSSSTWEQPFPSSSSSILAPNDPKICLALKKVNSLKFHFPGKPVETTIKLKTFSRKKSSNPWDSAWRGNSSPCQYSTNRFAHPSPGARKVIHCKPDPWMCCHFQLLKQCSRQALNSLWTVNKFPALLTEVNTKRWSTKSCPRRASSNLNLSCQQKLYPAQTKSVLPPKHT